MNDLAAYSNVFDGIEPYAGPVPAGYLVDFLGVLTDATFRNLAGPDPTLASGDYVRTELLTLASGGEHWFEVVNCVRAAREARERFVMMTLGACYGSPAVCAHRILELVNPLPCKLVAVDPVPENVTWAEKHMRDNGIDPDQQWLLPVALSDTCAPVYFPIGSPGSGAQNCYATNERAARESYVRDLLAGDVERALRGLVIHNRTGLTKDLVPGEGLLAEIELVSAITLNEVLGPFEFVDYLEADMQQSEILVFPPSLELLRRRVRRLHIGTHGKVVHQRLQKLFADDGWIVVFSFQPNSSFETELGAFETNDGVLTLLNPDL